MQNKIISKMVLFFFILMPACLGGLLASCGLPQDEYVIFPNRINTQFRFVLDNVTFTNGRDDGNNSDYYNPNRVKGYNFFYRIYTEADYLKVTSNEDFFDDDIGKRILADARAKLTKNNQLRFTTPDTIDEINKIARPFYRFAVSSDANGPFNYTGPHISASASDFEHEVNGVDVYLPVEYRFEVPTVDRPYPEVYIDKRDGIEESDSTRIKLFRRVFSTKDSVIKPKKFSGNEFNYLDDTTGDLVTPDEDISISQINKNQDIFYVAYFVSLFGMQDTPTINPLASEVGLLGVQKFSFIWSPEP